MDAAGYLIVDLERDGRRCHLGDFTEYARLRRELTDLESDAARQNARARKSAIEDSLAGIPSNHAKALESLMTLEFQTFEDVSLLAA